MKNLLFYFCIYTVLISILVITQLSCFKGQSDACAGVTCHNGTCANGNCYCLYGYLGPNCDSTLNAYLAGTFKGHTESSDGATPDIADVVVLSAVNNTALGVNLFIKSLADTLHGNLTAGFTMAIANQPHQTQSGYTDTLYGSAYLITTNGDRSLNTMNATIKEIHNGIAVKTIVFNGSY